MNPEIVILKRQIVQSEQLARSILIANHNQRQVQNLVRWLYNGLESMRREPDTIYSIS